MPNVTRMRETLEYIKAHSGEWDQAGWDTCFAGITCKLAGYEIAPGACQDESGAYIEVLAAELLGVGLEEASDTLYSGYLTLADLERSVAQYESEEAA